jgi:hypothetical protein
MSPTNNPQTYLISYQYGPAHKWHHQKWDIEGFKIIAPLLISLGRTIYVKDGDTIWQLRKKKDLPSLLLNLFYNRLSARSPEDPGKLE